MYESVDSINSGHVLPFYLSLYSWLWSFLSAAFRKVTVAGEGGLRALVALSRCEDLELRILAAGALRHLSLNTRVKRPMVEEGALGSILR